MRATEHWAARLLGGIGAVERLATAVAFLVLVLVLFGDVASRELTGAGLAWARPVGVYANLFLTFIGIGIASADGAHLRPRFADRWLPAAWNPAVESIGEGLMSAFCAAMVVVATLTVAETRLLQERLPFPAWLVWPFQSVIPVVFAIASLRHGLYCVYPALRPSAAAAAADVGADPPRGRGRP